MAGSCRSRSGRSFSGNCHAIHESLEIRVIIDRVVLEPPVVPDCDGAFLPPNPAGQLRSCGERVEHREQAVALGPRQPDNLLREHRVHVQALASCHGVGSDDRVLDLVVDCLTEVVLDRGFAIVFGVTRCSRVVGCARAMNRTKGLEESLERLREHLPGAFHRRVDSIPADGRHGLAE